MLIEPIGTRRQDTVTLFDIRAEKQFRFGSKARFGVFADVFNIMNSNTAVNISWVSGATFERATTVLEPAHRQVRREVRLVGADSRTAASG